MMARKKVEASFQQEIETNEDWNKLLKRPGLIVVDAYQSYTGPLKAMESRLRAINNTLGSDRLIFATAKADNIDSLKEYRDTCEPCFLFFAGSYLVALVRGANAPAIIKTIQEQLEHEEKVLKGEAQRKPIKDSFLVEKTNNTSADDDAKQADNADDANDKIDNHDADDKTENQDAPDKTDSQDAADKTHNQNGTDKIENVKQKSPCTICIIKPDMMAQNKKDEIIQKILEKGYKIVEQKEVKFTEEMAHEFYKHKKDSPQYDDLIKYMTSDVSCVLALSKEKTQDVVSELRNDLDHDDKSLRAQYATNQIINSLHGSDSHEAAIRELSFFFSNKTSPKQIQRTIALIRPTAFAHHKDQILKRIKDSGFEIAMTKSLKFDEKQAEEFYAEHKDKPFFEDLVKEMTSGQMMVLCLVKDDAINAWRNVLGPKEKEKIKEATGTLRNEFDVPELAVNSLHGPSNEEQAKRELDLFFPKEQTIALIKPGLAPEKKAEIEKKIKESGFIISSKKSQTLTEDIAKEIYKNSADKPYFDELVSLMTNGETDIYMLSRENAIDGWRDMIGPADPNEAKKVGGLRGVYGLDVLHNAVHGPSNRQQAEHEIKLFFGDTH